MFSGFFIDLRDVKTETKVKSGKAEILLQFQNLLSGVPGSMELLMNSIQPSSNNQYTKGI
jgi:U32 family peptidase